MRFVYDDGGRVAAGFGDACDTQKDCGVRAVAIASGRPYLEVYRALAIANVRDRRVVGGAPGPGLRIGPAYAAYMKSLGFEYHDKKCRFSDRELPMGRLVVLLRDHLTAVIDHVIYDLFDAQEEILHLYNFDPVPNGRIFTYSPAYVLGYWRLTDERYPR
jgi:hypothetical protein